MRTSVPENTIFDTNPEYLDIEPNGRKFMKLILLEFADQKNLQAEFKMDDTKTIDMLEELIRKGAIQVVERTNGDLQLLVTPTGAVTAFFERLKQ